MEAKRSSKLGGKGGIFVIAAFLAVVGLAHEARASNRLAGIEQQGETFIVNSTADSGPNTLRWLLGGVWDHDIITFDPAIFPPSVPVTIFLTSGELPHILRPNVTVDASNAGVILDGSSMSGGWVCGLQIVSSDSCVIRGLQFSNFSGAGIAISGDSKYNVIGGDRSLGAGPFGQGNQFSHNDVGISLSTTGTSLNTITGNLIGTYATGAFALGNHKDGVWICEGANRNTIGPDNVIAHNGGPGVNVHDPDSLHNTITQNSIHDNGSTGINLWGGGNAELAAPIIFDFDLQAGTMMGLTCADCTVEVFSDSSDEGAIYEGRTTANDAGLFTFSKGDAFIGPHLTATATDVNSNTSEFSLPTSAAAPVACVVGGDRVVEAGEDCEAQVALDGSCSSDADSTAGTNDDINDFDWYEVIDVCDPNSDIYLGSGEVIECNLGLGEHLIVLEVTDKAGAFDGNEVVITVEDATPPEIVLNGLEMVVLRCGIDSYAEEGATATDNCDEDVAVVIGGDAVDTSACGSYVVTYDATDASGNVADQVMRTVIVEDTIPPAFALFVTPDVLWPPNNKMVKITPWPVVGDHCDEQVEVSLVDVSMNVAGDINDYAEIGDDGSIYLKAAKDKEGSSRVYTLVYEAVDDSGNVTEASATVTVPHSRGRSKLRERMRKRLYITEDRKAAEWRKQVQK